MTGDYAPTMSTGITWSDNTGSWLYRQIYPTAPTPTVIFPYPVTAQPLPPFQPAVPQEATLKLWKVYVVYAENRKSPVVSEHLIVAQDADQAKMLVPQQETSSRDWDYLTFLVEEIGVVKAKPKPQEVKQA